VDKPDKPAKLSPTAAFEAIQKLLDETDTVSLPRHARDRMAERHFNLDDVKNVLRKGTVSPDAEWDEKRRNWKYKVRGLDCDGERLEIVIALDFAFATIALITGGLD